ncbi:MAG: hypothetical protein J5580_00880 [Clostridia bacterium]|nr:hypothetical protein [Clostridia bacterium]
MKKKITIVSLIICSVLLVICCVSVFLISKDKQNSTTTLETLNMNYFKNLQLDIEDVKSLGISNENLENEKQLSTASIRTAESNSKNSHSKYFLYATKENSNGEIRFEKVKFKKHSSIQEDVYDDKNQKIDYQITQDKLNTQINKLYITEKYTFIQFIALVAESGTYSYQDENKQVHEEYVTLRPNDLTYNNGVSDFDTMDYFSNHFTYSFVISNETNHIYKITDFTIKKIKDGLVSDENGLIYQILIDEDNNLQFNSLFNNPNITVLDCFQDTYGNNYIKNTTVNEIDAITNTVFYTTGYYRTVENVVIKIDGNIGWDSNTQINRIDISAVKKVGKNLQLMDILANEKFDFENQRIAGEYYDSWNKLSKIENGKLYLFGASVSSKVLFTIYDLELNCQKSYYIVSNYIYPISNDTIIHFSNETNKVGNLSYLIINFEDVSNWDMSYSDVDYYLSSESLGNEVQLLLANCLWNYKFLTNEECQWNNFSIDTIAARKEYTVTQADDGTVKLELIDDFTSNGNIIISFQPIKMRNA